MTTTDEQQPAVLVAQGLRKTYGGVRALRGVDLELRLGEVHALVGENGAGKSTLIKLLAGVESPDEGTIEVRGERLAPGDPVASLAAGISTVYQEAQLFDELTVAETVFLGRELTTGGRVRWREQLGRARELLEQIGLDPALATRRVGDLSVGERQLVSIVKAFAMKVRVLILDEPSAILADRDIEVLFGVVRRMRDAGVGVIYISHRLDELVQICDRVTVLRDGEVVVTSPLADLTTRELAELMVGHELGEVDAGGREISADVVLDVAGLAAGRALRDLSLRVHGGQIVGVYGLIGSGTSELAHALFGVLPTAGGTVHLDGRPLPTGDPAKAAAAGVALLPANRKSQGVFLDKALTFNLSVSHLRWFSRLRIVVDRAREHAVTGQFMERLRIKAPTPRTPIGALSGGNQQKVVLARQLVESPRLLVLEEPTQGVDVGAKGEIHRLVIELAAQGTAVLLVSTDLDEVRVLADRVLVLRHGAVAGTFERGVRAADLLAAAAGDTALEGAGR